MIGHNIKETGLDLLAVLDTLFVPSSFLRSAKKNLGNEPDYDLCRKTALIAEGVRTVIYGAFAYGLYDALK